MTRGMWWGAGLTVAGTSLLGAAGVIAAAARADGEAGSPAALALLLAGAPLLFLGVRLLSRGMREQRPE